MTTATTTAIRERASTLCSTAGDRQDPLGRRTPSGAYSSTAATISSPWRSRLASLPLCACRVCTLSPMTSGNRTSGRVRRRSVRSLAPRGCWRPVCSLLRASRQWPSAGTTTPTAAGLRRVYIPERRTPIPVRHVVVDPRHHHQQLHHLYVAFAGRPVERPRGVAEVARRSIS